MRSRYSDCGVFWVVSFSRSASPSVSQRGNSSSTILIGTGGVDGDAHSQLVVVGIVTPLVDGLDVDDRLEVVAAFDGEDS